MTRHYGIPPQVRGRAELIEDASRDAMAWPHGRLWRARAAVEPVETAGITRLPWGVELAVWAFVLAPVWAGIIATIRWALS